MWKAEFMEWIDTGKSEAHLAMHGRILGIIIVSTYSEVDSLIMKDIQIGGEGEQMLVWRNSSV